MRVSVETAGGLARKATVAVPSATFEERVAAGLKEAAGGLKLPGFRPGKVPMKEVRRRLGATVRGQVARDLSIASFSEAMRAQPFTLATQAQIEIVNLAPGADLEFTAVFEVLPEVALAAFDSLKVRRPKAAIDDADIDVTIEQMRRQKRDWVAVERPVQAGDRVVLDYVLRHGEAVAHKREGWTVVLDRAGTDMLSKRLVGLSVNETHRFLAEIPAAAQQNDAADAADAPLGVGRTAPPPVVVAGVEEDAPELDTNVDSEGLAAGEGLAAESGVDAAGADGAGQADAEEAPPDAQGAALTTEITVLSVEAPVLPPVDDAFFDWFGVEAGADRQVKFRAAVRERMALELRAAQRRVVSQEVLAALVDAHEFELPAAMVEAETAAEVERLRKVVAEVPPELALAARSAAERRLRGQLVLRAIIARESMQADDARVRARVDEIASAYEEAAQVRRMLYADEQQLGRIEAKVLEEQVLEHVLEQAQVSTVDMPYQDLVGGQPLPASPDAAAPADSAAASDGAQSSQDGGVAGSPKAPADVPGPAAAKPGLLGKVKRLLGR